MNAPSKFPLDSQARPGEAIRIRAADAIERLREAAERNVPSATRARRIADSLDEALNRPSEQPILDGPNAAYTVVAYLWRDYRYAIDNICAEQGGWERAPLSSFADACEGARHPLQSTTGMGAAA